MRARSRRALAAGAFAGALTLSGAASAQWAPPPQGAASAQWAPPPPPPDWDRDGVPDYYDQCPAEHVGRFYNPAYPGCPGYSDDTAAGRDEPKPKKKRGPAGTMAAGIVVTSVSFGFTVVGVGMLVANAGDSLFARRNNDEALDVGAGLTIGGLVGLAVGVPLLIYGVRVFKDPKAAAASQGPVINVHAGLGTGGIRVQF